MNNKRLVFDGMIVGILGGAMSVIYRLALEKASTLRTLLFSNTNIIGIIINILTLFTMAVLVYILLKIEPLSSGSGIPQVQAENQGLVSMNALRVVLSKFAGGIAANIGGLSLGREGPSIQIGAASGKLLAQAFGRNEDETEYMISAGASAGLAAAFNAPMAGTLFTVEEMHKKFTPILLVPSLVASVFADFISKNIFGVGPAFVFHITRFISLPHYWHLLIFGVITGLLGAGFNRVLLLGLKFFDILKVHDLIKKMIPFLAMGITGYFAYLLLGGGHDLISETELKPIALSVMIFLFIAKFVFTCMCYGSGAQGGIFLPVLVLGGLIGSIYYVFMNMLGVITLDYYSNFIILGMVGYLTAVVRSPILSIMLVTEMTRNFNSMLPCALVAIIAYVVANITRTEPVYESLLNRLVKNISSKK